MKSKSINSVFTTLIILVLANSSCNSQPLSPNVTNNHIVNQPLPNPTQTIDVSQPVEENAVLFQTVNDITVEVTSAKIISTGVEIGVCYTTLDGGDWYLAPGHLLYGKYEIYPDEFEFTTEVKGTDAGTGIRCALVRYKIDDLASITVPIRFSIIDVTAVPREMSACQNFQIRLDSNSKAKALGIKANCEETGDGNVSVKLLDYDKSIVKDDAHKVLNEIAGGVIVGPWEFTFTEIER